MLGNLSYFNSSIIDTYVGEFSRSVRKHHVIFIYLIFLNGVKMKLMKLC